MKLAFSNKGWDELSFNDILKEAKENEFTGIEIFDPIKDSKMMSKDGPFNKYNAPATVRRLKEMKIKITAFDTSYDISDKSCDIKGIADTIKLAKAMGVPYIAVGAETDDKETVIEKLDAVIPVAEENNRIILIRTTGVYCDTSKVRLGRVLIQEHQVISMNQGS